VLRRRYTFFGPAAVGIPPPWLVSRCSPADLPWPGVAVAIRPRLPGDSLRSGVIFRVVEIGLPFVRADCRVPAGLIYSTVVPTGGPPRLGRIARTAPVGHRGREFAHALHEVCHGDRGYLRSHAHDDGHPACAKEEGRPDGSQAARDGAFTHQLASRETRITKERGGGRRRATAALPRPGQGSASLGLSCAPGSPSGTPSRGRRCAARGTARSGARPRGREP
jgi:hypothetical protein